MSSSIKPVLGSQLNLGHPLAEGIVFYPVMNEGSGEKVFGLSENGHIGTFSGGHTWIAGKRGPSIQMAGVGTWISFPTTPALGTQYTKCEWLTPADTTADQYVSDFGGVNEAATILGFQNGYWNYYGGQYPIGNVANNSRILCSGVGIQDFLAWTVNGTALKGYLNGVLQISGTITAGDFSPSAAFRFGGRYDAVSDEYSGIVDGISFYNRVLTAPEIALLYREPFIMFDRNPIELWVGSVGAGAPAGNAGVMTPNTGYWGPTF